MNRLLKKDEIFRFQDNVSGCLIYDIRNHKLPHKEGVYIGANNFPYSKEILSDVSYFNSVDEFLVVDAYECPTLRTWRVIAERKSDHKKICFEQVISDSRDLVRWSIKYPESYPKINFLQEAI